MSKTYIPAGYAPLLNLYDTQKAIGLLNRVFEDTLCGNLHLRRVSAPLFVEAASGLNDDLNGVERPVAGSTNRGAVTRFKCRAAQSFTWNTFLIRPMAFWVSYSRRAAL